MKFNKEQKIIHHLMLKSFDIKNVGLLEGKMGIIIFFYHYSKYIDNNVYGDFAGDLLDELLGDIHKELPLTFASGLSGIAWGIEYLIQNNFVEGDSNEICEELDKKIMTVDPRRLDDNSLEIGLEGVIHYALARICGAVKQSNPYPFDSLYITDLIYAVESSLNKKESTRLNILFKLLLSCIKGQCFEYSFNMKRIIESQYIVNSRNIYSSPLGLKNGLSGYLLNQII